MCNTNKRLIIEINEKINRNAVQSAEVRRLRLSFVVVKKITKLGSHKSEESNHEVQNWNNYLVFVYIIVLLVRGKFQVNLYL